MTIDRQENIFLNRVVEKQADRKVAYLKEVGKIVQGRTRRRDLSNVPPSRRRRQRSFLNRAEIFVAECRCDRAASSHELQAWPRVRVDAFESRVDTLGHAANSSSESACNTDNKFRRTKKDTFLEKTFREGKFKLSENIKGFIRFSERESINCKNFEKVPRVME